ncbi:unnamed protein product [Eruca vesicaria subsp. sativa]|uniref:non-specific serine/threonine protein kinase n=1 Tax=Eruca vesicaria subsp. sativa TaxID=29727 RepID=A0ABC8ITB7_ERUVS|nr:unnamed protein product [Eruca vesicaria subsp. sativa]
MDMSIVFSSFILFCFLAAQITAAASPALLHPDELKALEEMATTLGITKLNLGNGDPCDLKRLKIDVAQDPGSENIIVCECRLNNICHITDLTLKTLGLPGKLPPELVKLKYLRSIDFCRNYLSGSIPMEWASMLELTSIAVCANNLSGPLPTGLQNFKKLEFLGIEANQFSGPIPDELGNMTSLRVLQLGSNQFTSSLPTTLARLVNLKDFRISDNKFNGTIPGFIGDWFRLEKMRISDMAGINSFPNLSSKSTMNTLILRNLSMSGQIPSYVWSMPALKTLDVSFNKLTGEVELLGKVPQYTYLNDNMLSGKVGSDAFFNNESYITGLLPCASPIKCKYQRSLHINCGGDNVVITTSSHKITYQADNNKTKAATNQHFENWGISSTGYLPNNNYIITPTFTPSENSPAFYKSARQAAQSLVYYAFCLENGAYNVKLHFMELQFSNEEPYNRLGRRIFDIYLQGELFRRDFNIKEEANGTRKPIVKEANVNVTNHLLEIRLYWAGKGTIIIPLRGNYGPIISAISFIYIYNFNVSFAAENTKHHSKYPLIFGIMGTLLAVMLLALGLYYHKRCRGDKNTRERDLRAQSLQTVCFTWRQLQAATNNFDEANKLGEGGFGSVFKGEMSDGTIIAVKQLSAKSCQGNREFVNEIGMISGLNHPNLVKLYGCCVEKNELLLVYEYMENNSLALALYEKSAPKLDWAARQKICVGIARGLEFLHEGSMIRMVHRDIKTSNVLLDADLNAKISDFGLARLHEEEETQVSTKIVGTIGYMAPEYALYGELTEKADVFSFGIVAMEIVSGKSNKKQKGSADHVWLINWAWKLQQTGDTVDIIDPVLEDEFNSKEAERMIKVALICTNSSPLLRPTMSEVVQMLEGEMEITQVLSDPGLYEHNLGISKLRGTDTQGSSSTSGLTDQTTTTMKSSVSSTDLYPLYPESMIFSSSAF